MESEFCSVKEINSYKKKLNWGELPGYYHQVSASLAELEGMFKHGFDNAAKQILDKDNWNLTFLGVENSTPDSIQVVRKPQIMLRRHNSEHGYELNCFPIVDGKPIYDTLLVHPRLPFKTWQSHSMSNLLRISDLAEFIRYSYVSGDSADMLLIKHANRLVEQLVLRLKLELDVVEDSGYTINDMLAYVDQRLKDINSANKNKGT